jgi:cytochrome bd-type quinol oxidase subunit 1
VFIQYWSMRVMAYIGSLVFLLAIWGAWIVHRKKVVRARLFLFVAVWAVIAPFLMNTAGWLLTESGRQPWIVQGLLLTKNAASKSVSATDVWISLISFLAAYVVLGVACAYLMIRFGRRELPDEAPVDARRGGDEAALVY